MVPPVTDVVHAPVLAKEKVSAISRTLPSLMVTAGTVRSDDVSTVTTEEPISIRVPVTPNVAGACHAMPVLESKLQSRAAVTDPLARVAPDEPPINCSLPEGKLTVPSVISPPFTVTDSVGVPPGVVTAPVRTNSPPAVSCSVPATSVPPLTQSISPRPLQNAKHTKQSTIVHIKH